MKVKDFTHNTLLEINMDINTKFNFITHFAIPSFALLIPNG